MCGLSLNVGPIQTPHKALHWFKKYTGSLHIMVLIRKSCSCPCLVAQSCLTLCDPMDCSPLGSSVHGIFLARILEWVAMSSFREEELE